MPATDAELVRQATAGSVDAFSLLYQRYQQPTTRYVYRIVQDSQLAEDVVQDAFVSALRRLATLRDPERFRPWLFSIAHHAAVDHVRRDGPVLLPQMPELATEDDSPEAADAAELVWDAAASLEPRQLAVLELTLREQVSNSELGTALGVSTAHAAVLAHRTRAALGHAVRILLVTRSQPKCARLAALVPTRPRKLTLSQRNSVDRHLRRCPKCSRLASKLTVPMALLGALLLAAEQRQPVQPVSMRGPLLLKRLAIVGAIALGWWLVPWADNTPGAESHGALPVPAIIVTTTVAPPPPTTTAAPTTTTTVAPPPTEGERMVTLINKRRSAAGCSALRTDPRLLKAATQHSSDMARNGYIAMNGPNGETLDNDIRSAGYPGPTGSAVAASTETAAETLTKLYPDGSVADCGDRAIGVYRAVGGPCGYYWTLIFGRR